MLVVVRCPGCRGAARVSPEALGLLVGCPRCPEQFVAVEEAPVSPPAPRAPAAPRPSQPRPEPRPRSPLAPPEADEPRSRGWAEPVAPPPDADAPPPADRRARRRPTHPEPHDHAHRDHAAGGLPVSVLIGLALLPFAIPLLWVIAPLVMGRPPVLSLAAPAALAVAASTLCLAVISTVDWSPTTRIKGVLMLVGLAYFTGLSLYFLKKDMLDRAKNFFGPDREWKDFSPPDQSYAVRMPAKPTGTQDQQIPDVAMMCYTVSEKRPLAGVYTYVVGSGKDPKPEQGDEEWFNEVQRTMRKAGRGLFFDQETVPPRQGFPGRQWEVEVNKPREIVRIVRIYRAQGRVYFLSVEGPNLSRDDEPANEFFEKFLPTPKE